MSAAMRGYALFEFGQSPRIMEVALPEPGPRDVRVRVEASSVNPFDAMAGAGFFQHYSDHRLPAVLGRDVAGTVDKVGAEVTMFRPGDQVLGMVKRDYIGDGTFADFVVVPEDRFIVHRPDGLGIEEAGALGLASVTAALCLGELGLARGETVLINGATGGVGAFAVQLAAAAGARVVATARPGEEEDHVRALGAAETVDWSVSTSEGVLSLHPDGVDGVIDLVSRATESFEAVARLARPGKAAVTTLSVSGDGFVEGRRTANIHSDGDPALLTRVAELAASGELRVPLVDVLPFDRIDDAFALLAAAPRGKVALKFA